MTGELEQFRCARCGAEKWYPHGGTAYCFPCAVWMDSTGLKRSAQETLNGLRRADPDARNGDSSE
jgi:hypothetical protein